MPFRLFLGLVLAFPPVFLVFVERATAADEEIGPASPAAKRPKAKLAEKAAQGTFPRGQWSDLVRLVDPKKRAVGQWSVKEKALEVAAPERPARLAIPVIPGESYNVKIEFTRTDGEGTVGVILPVGPRQCLVAANFHGGPSGIDMIDGRRADKNDSTFPGALANDRRYTLEISVRLDGSEAAITANLDDRPLVFYRGPASSLALHKEWALPQKNVLGLAAESAVTFHKLQFRPVSGTARIVE